MTEKTDIPGANIQVYVPLLTTDEKGLDLLKRKATEMAKIANGHVKILKFSMREELEDFDGRKFN